MTDDGSETLARHTEDWKSLPWKQFQHNVFRLQRRIYKASHRGDFRQRPQFAKAAASLFFSKMSGGTQGITRQPRETHSGVDGVPELSPRQRTNMVDEFRNFCHTPSPHPSSLHSQAKR